VSISVGVIGARGIPSTYGGYETFLTVLLPELVRRGHDVTAYCRRRDVEDAAEYQGVRKVTLPAIRTKSLSTLSHGAVASAAAWKGRHDVVLALNVANSPFCLGLRLVGQRTVLNTDGQEWLRGKWGRAGRTYFRLAAKLAGRSATALVADSAGMGQIYAGQFGASSTVIPYCWTKLEKQPDGAILESLGLEAQGYFLVAGRLVPENNIDRVAASYVRSGVTTPLVVLGAANYDSPVQQRLNELAAQCPTLKLAGHVKDRSAYATLVGEAKAYFHGHSVGGINPSLLEAMGCGARIAALDTTFSREALASTGAYFEDFEKELPLLIRRLNHEPTQESAEFRRAAADRVRTTFSLKLVADAYEGLLHEVVSARRHHRVVLKTAWAQGADSVTLRAA
jgi:glycosyltransferase involved in cell wall biosynthesis